ncbi:MAG TPA: DUF5615 family PIN-like protein [Verrucomicrobiae bacterium]|nr:DUF5615 family PIN-like protein [Verrucomicrobiae bacterium]
MRILLDMNLAPAWVGVLADAGHEARHWGAVGAHDASDATIIAWAKANGHVVFTHDLDYGALLHATGAVSPSVIQIRGEEVRPATMAATVVTALETAAEDLAKGALVTIDPRKMRVAVLPLRKD